MACGAPPAQTCGRRGQSGSRLPGSLQRVPAYSLWVLRPGETAALYGKAYGNATALAGLRSQLHAAAQFPGTSVDVRDARPADGLILGPQARAVVFDRKHRLAVPNLQLSHDGRAAGVACGVVNALFENQEDLPPCLQTQLRGLAH